MFTEEGSGQTQVIGDDLGPLFPQHGSLGPGTEEDSRSRVASRLWIAVQVDVQCGATTVPRGHSLGKREAADGSINDREALRLELEMALVFGRPSRRDSPQRTTGYRRAAAAGQRAPKDIVEPACATGRRSSAMMVVECSNDDHLDTRGAALGAPKRIAHFAAPYPPADPNHIAVGPTS